MARVLLEGVTKSFGELVAVDDLNLEVKDRELVCLLGPSGCGKTTTLRMISGLDKPTAGHVYIGDVMVNDLTPKERDVAMVFQFYALYPDTTVFENMAFPLKARKMHKNEIEKKVEETAEMLRIPHLLDKKTDGLTVAEKQRVALGRAFVREPNVFLLDEPLTNLDARLRATMRAELKNLIKRIGVTTIYVTHDQVEALTLAEKIAVMDQGELLQYDPTKTVYGKPKNTFVAGFIGSPPMNFIDCTLEEEDGKAHLKTETFQLDVTDLRDLIRIRATSPELILGVRPEDISAYKQRVQKDAISTEVYVVEPIGDRAILDLMIGEHIIKTVASATFVAEMGEKVWITLDRNKIHLFDRKTKEAIL